jgi:hypothetical protein
MFCFLDKIVSLPEEGQAERHLIYIRLSLILMRYKFSIFHMLLCLSSGPL